MNTRVMRGRARGVAASALAAALVVGMLVGDAGVDRAQAASPASDSADRIAIGRGHTLLIGNDGRVYGTGNNESRQLTGSATSLQELTVLAGLPDGVRAEAVATGHDHSLVVGSDGRAYSAGANGSGQLGRTAPNAESRGTLLPMVGLPAGVNAVDVAAGTGYSVVLASNGQVYGSGRSEAGQITGTASQSSLHPFSGLPTGGTASGIAAGSAHTLVTVELGSSNALYGTGSDASGQLAGAGNLTTLTPLPGQPPGVTDAAASFQRSAMIDKSGTAYAVGAGGFAALPGAPAGYSAREIGVGSAHTVVLYRQSAAPHQLKTYGLGTVTTAREMGALAVGGYPALTEFAIQGSAAEPRGIAAGGPNTAMVYGNSLIRASGSNTGWQLTGSPGAGVPGRTLDTQPVGVLLAPALSAPPRVNTAVSFTGSWIPSDANANSGRQWLIDGSPIAGATGQQFTPTTAHHDRMLSVRLTVSASGFGSVEVETAPQRVAGIAQIENTVPPSITGTARLGQSVSSSTGSWSVTGITQSRQWLRDGVAIPGATASSYTPVAADVGTQLSLRVTASRNGYDPGVAESTAVTVLPAQFVVDDASPPQLSEAALGDFASVASLTGRLAPNPTSRSFAWLRNGVVAATTTTSSYQLAEAQGWAVGDSLEVRITSSRAGYEDDVWTSPPRTVLASAPIVITSQPASVSVTAGGTAQFTVSATGYPTPEVFMWVRCGAGQECGSNDWVAVGQGSDTLTVPEVTLAQNGERYRALLWNGDALAMVHSDIATLTVTEAPAPPAPGFAAGPTSRATVGKPYRSQVRATAPDGVTFSRARGALPPGVKLAANGRITGTPKRAGRYVFTVRATAASGSSSIRQYAVTVAKGTAKVAVKVSPKRPKAKKTKATVRVRVSAPKGVVPLGKVRVQVRGKTVRTVTLGAKSRGIVKIKLPRFAKKGRTVVKAVYLGDRNLKRASRQATLRVR